MRKLLLLLGIVFLLPFVYADTATDTIACYDFESNGDDYLGNFDLTETGSVSYSPMVNGNGAFFGGGLNYLKADNSLINGSEYTLAWFGNYTPGGLQQFICNSANCFDGTLEGFDVHISGGGLLIFDVGNTGAEGGQYYQINSAIAENSPSVPYHIAVVLNSTALTVYVNGIFNVSDTTSSGTLSEPNGDFILGARNPQLDLPGEHVMDQLQLWDRALTRNDIVEHYNTGSGLTCADSTAMADMDAPVIVINPSTPANNSITTTLPIVFNFTITDDVAVDDIIFDFNGTTENNTLTNNFDDVWTVEKDMFMGNITWGLKVTDTSGNITEITSYFFEVDEIFPNIHFTVPEETNDSEVLNSTDFNIFGSNLHLDIGNLTIFDDGNNIVFQNVTTGIGASTFTFLNNVQDMIGDEDVGNYTALACFVDIVQLETCEAHTFEFVNTPIPPTVSEEVVQTSNRAVAFLSVLLTVGFIVGIIGSINWRGKK